MQARCDLTYNPLSELYIQFHRNLNANLKWDPSLQHEACRELMEPGYSTAPYKFRGEKAMKAGAPLSTNVRRALVAGLRNDAQKHNVQLLPPGSEFGCTSLEKGGVMHALCVYWTPVD
ncbi:hypothetical protein COOONC_12171 [Cooperia oncophora]